MTAAFDIDAFFEKVYAVVRAPAGIDLIFSTVNDVLDGLIMESFDDTMEELGGPRVLGVKSKAPQYAVVDELLARADPWKMHDSCSLAFLTMTFRHKAKFQNYLPYLEKVRKRLRESGDERRTKALLKGYEPA